MRPDERDKFLSSDKLGRPLHDLRISVTDKCNFRCPYCMPAEKYHENYDFLKGEQLLGFGEITRLARIYTSLGVRKVRLTGGEPLLRQGLANLIEELCAIEEVEDIALTTNGSLLENKVEVLAAAGLDRVTVSLDSVDDAVFGNMTGGRECLPDVLAGIFAAQRAGLAPVKVNAVVMRGNNEEGVLELLNFFRGTGIIVRLVEFMDVGTINQWSRDRIVPYTELLERINRRWPLESLEKNYAGEVANRYRYKDGQGEVGFINSITQPFCTSCSRARLSADGKMYSCLFAAEGLDLRTPLRKGATDAEIRSLMVGKWIGRDDRYSMDRAAARQAKKGDRIEMFYIGG